MKSQQPTSGLQLPQYQQMDMDFQSVQAWCARRGTYLVDFMFLPVDEQRAVAIGELGLDAGRLETVVEFAKGWLRGMNRAYEDAVVRSLQHLPLCRKN